MNKNGSENKTGKGLVFAGLGMEIIGMMIGSVIVGREVDKLTGWPGYSVIFLVLASFGVWVWHIIAIAKKFMQDVSDSATPKD